MTRPMYQTNQDLIHEIEVVQKFCDKLDYKYSKLPISYHLDFMLTYAKTNHFCGMAEVKTRSHNFGTFKTFLISLLKYTSCLDWQQKYNIPVYIIVDFKGTTYYYLLDSSPFELGAFVVHGGRTKATRDAADIEPVVHIPIRYFKKL